ncbi:MAG: transposase, partial [Acidobacteriaceae bacterium]
FGSSNIAMGSGKGEPPNRAYRMRTARRNKLRNACVLTFMSRTRIWSGAPSFGRRGDRRVEPKMPRSGWKPKRYTPAMPRGLKRFYGGGDLHFLTFSCYQRRPYLATPHAKNIFLYALEQVRQRYQFSITGYVVMPEHVHLLVSEPETVTPSRIIQVLKQNSSRKLNSAVANQGEPFWLTRFMISTSGQNKSASKNCAICIATQ